MKVKELTDIELFNLVYTRETSLLIYSESEVEEKRKWFEIGLKEGRENDAS